MPRKARFLAKLLRDITQCPPSLECWVFGWTIAIVSLYIGVIAVVVATWDGLHFPDNLRFYKIPWGLDTSQIQTDYSHYDLALKKCFPQDQWSIHGVWPSLNAHQWPSYCHNTPFDSAKVDSIRSQLKKDWSTCENRWEFQTDRTFWRHEWLKHGTCTGWKQLEYFQTGLDLFQTAHSQGWITRFCQQETDNCLIPLDLHLNQSG